MGEGIINPHIVRNVPSIIVIYSVCYVVHWICSYKIGGLIQNNIRDTYGNIAYGAAIIDDYSRRIRTAVRVLYRPDRYLCFVVQTGAGIQVHLIAPTGIRRIVIRI